MRSRLRQSVQEVLLHLEQNEGKSDTDCDYSNMMSLVSCMSLAFLHMHAAAQWEFRQLRWLMQTTAWTGLCDTA